MTTESDARAVSADSADGRYHIVLGDIGVWWEIIERESQEVVACVPIYDYPGLTAARVLGAWEREQEER